MNMRTIESNIITAYDLKDINSIQNIYTSLLNTRAKLDRWFNKYLDMFDEKFSSMESTDPAQKLYNVKFNEYVQLNKTIKIAEHYLEKA